MQFLMIFSTCSSIRGNHVFDRMNDLVRLIELTVSSCITAAWWSANSRDLPKVRISVKDLSGSRKARFRNRDELQC